jgi:hypothetical protein
MENSRLMACEKKAGANELWGGSSAGRHLEMGCNWLFPTIKPKRDRGKQHFRWHQ